MKLHIRRLINQMLVSCSRCHGMGVIELPNGDTKECHICGGKGYLK